jgi:hypothetical protein
MKKLYTFLFGLLAVSFASAQVNVTFSVDMTNETVAAEGVHIAGDFQGWSPNSTPLTDDGNGVYSVTLSLEAGAYEFKFINGNDWPQEEAVPDACRANLTGNTNRRIEVGMMDATYAVCFSSCAACGEYAVLFRVDMSLQEEIAPQGVHVAGEFNGWDAGANELFDADGDGVYMGLYAFDPAVLDNGNLIFKYINGDSFLFPNESISDECGTGTNRVLELTAANTVTPNYCFNQCGTCVSPVPVTFRVDMTNEDVSPNGVHIAGELNTVGTWNPGVDEMLPVGNNIYEITLNLQPGEYEYKFVNGNAWDGADNDNESVPSACATNNNRVVTVVADEPQTITYCYNQCASECSVNPEPAAITFLVNTADITVSASGIWLIGNFTDPQWQAGATQMTDTDGDGIYEATLTVSGPAEFQYKYTNGNPFPGGVVDATVEESYDFSIGLCGASNGIGGFNRIYVRSGQPETLGVTCYNSCVDCGQNISESSMAFGLTVYPNPTNNQLNIASDGEQGVAEITVYDMQGRAVLSTSINFVGTSAEQVNVQALVDGLYMVAVRLNGKVATTTFVKG